MTDRLAEILSDGAFAALLVAGDVYDRSIPSPEAVSLFGAFLGKVKARRPDLEILVIPGNHDSSSRLGFGKELFAELGVHFVTNSEDAFRPVMVDKAGSRGTERGAFFLLPFLNSGSLTAVNSEGEAEPLRSQSRLAEEASARLETARREALAGGADYAVLGAHLFISGGVESESERIFVGTAEQVPAELFASFDYTALGHLHRFQRAGERAWYSGSPLAYSFEEAKYDKAFLSVELEPGEKQGAPASLKVEPVPSPPLRKLWRLKGSFDYFFRDEGKDPVLKEAETGYLEAVLADANLTENPLVLLRRRFPWILSVKQDAAFTALKASAAQTDTPSRSGERRSPVEDFEDFLTEIYGEDDPDRSEKIKAFKELLEESEKQEAES